MMKPFYSLLLVAGIYCTVIGLGLLVGSNLIVQIEQEVIAPAVANPESPQASADLFLYILGMTGVILILLKFHFNRLIRALLLLAMFSGVFLSTWALVGDVGLFISIALIIIYYLKQTDNRVTTIVLIFTIAGIGGFMGASLAFTPALIFLLLLATYDVVAVFGSKHMVKLAQGAQEGKFQLMFLIPLGEKELGLGTGDLAIPTIFAVSVLRDYGLSHALITAWGGLIGLMALIYTIMQRKKVMWPALPPIAFGLIIGFLFSYSLTFI